MMNFYEWKVSDSTTVKLRMRSKDTVNLERVLKKNPMSIFMGVDKGELPKVEEMIYILQYALQSLEHGYDIDKTYNLYDEYIDNGGSMVDLIAIMLEVYQVSGIIPKDKKVEKPEDTIEEEEKNA